ncbi:response regulator [Neobacillus vireti]|uniref:response regulator n=1 Tax=Neobacillus vireti TaxID=220686 RepID=UPI002FFF23A1
MTKTVIVEDDPMVAEINRIYLEKMDGFELVAMARSVEEALPILQENKVDLILLDIQMPRDNGWSLLSNIRGLGSEIDVIIITASCDNASIKKGLRFGAVDYLIKPFEFERFQSALLSYQKNQMRINEQERLNQVDLDQLVLHKEQKFTEGYDLPKGLTKNTLCKVWRQVNEMGRTSFSTEEIACKVGISRISMRKYVKFLADIHALETDMVYGTIGRPIYMHNATIEGSIKIDYYINN